MARPADYRPAPGTIPTDPGVYRFSDPAGQVIYVGKAKSLRNRLNSYFADPDNLHFRTKTMVCTAAKVEWTVVRTEAEALQLEYTWIKQYDPRFNVRFRDDKSYPWLCVTWSDTFPRTFVGRGKRRKGWRYFGPFGQAWAVRDTVDSLLRIFPMRSCTDGVFRRAQAANRPCLFGDIGKCSAPCVGRVTEAQHRSIVKDFCSFWAGHTAGLEKKLLEQMNEASDNLEFEKAARLRDAIAALRHATEKSTVVLADHVDADVIGLADDPLEVAVQIFHVRHGRIRAERGWVADRPDDRPLDQLLESFLLSIYGSDQGFHGSGSTIPPEILVPVMPDTAQTVEELLAEQRGAKVHLHVPKRGDKKTILGTTEKNAQRTLAEHKMKRSADLSARAAAMQELQANLGMAQPPLRIEGYDISHLQGTEVVGSMVVFEDGMARKSEYRKFIIKTFDGSNDIAAMDEVLRRRLRRLIDERAQLESDDAVLIDPTTGAAKKFAYAPSLIVVDGGLPQVNAAHKVLEDLGLDKEIMLIGLAKRLEEVWIPGDDYPLILPRSSEGLYLLQRVRDESHRFAITFHRDRRSKAMVESILDQIPGLGQVRRNVLLKHFGSLTKLRQATLEDIMALPGFGLQTAHAVIDALEAERDGHSADVTVNTATGEITDGDR